MRRNTLIFSMLTLLTPMLLSACGGGDAQDVETAANPPAAQTVDTAQAGTARTDAEAEARNSGNAESAGETGNALDLDGFENVLRGEIENEIRSGFVYAVMRDGAVVARGAFGAADRENEIPMTAQTRFRIASMTKPITTTAILMLADDGALKLDDPVSKFIPELGDLEVAVSRDADASGAIPTEPLERPITIRHLMTHMAGLGYVFDQQTALGARHLEFNLYAAEGALADRVKLLANAPLYAQPGEQWIYSYATDALGRVVEVASGKSLEDFLSERLFAPLGMDDTEFAVDTSDLDDVAVVYAHNDDGVLIRYEGASLGENPNTNGAGWQSGGGGLISTVDDYLAYCQMLINGGTGPDGAQLLSKKRIDLMFESQVPPSARPDEWRDHQMSFGFGGWVRLAQPEKPGNSETTGHFGWGGYYDTSFVISRNDKLAYVLLAQREPGPNDKPSKAPDLIRALVMSLNQDV
ncbi:MAG: serine hydrolase domain-containing protein [Pseudomonadota bacterium]